MTLNGTQFWNDYDKMTAVGKTPEGGCERLSMSDEDIAARELLMSLLASEGLSPETDETGAIWARLEGTDSKAAPVLIGSHIDTVRNGGRYDGLLGVMLGFQVMRQLKQSNDAITRPVELVVFPTEESARFNYPTVGSKLLGGKIEPEKLKEMRDENGVSLFEALTSRGFSPNSPERGRQRLKNAFCMVELHIEQGPVLDKENISIGVVTAIAAPTRLSVSIEGEYAHSGACPMYLRHDALCAAAEFILMVEKIGRIEAVDKSVAAVTLCSLQNASMNVIPGRVDMAIDIRGIDADSIDRCKKGVERQLAAICDARGVSGSCRVISSDTPVLMDEHMMRAIRRACEKNRISFTEMPSGAGHDAMNVAPLLPTGMIFIPCKDGVSHNPEESVKKEDVANGFTVLYSLVLERANKK